MHWADEQGFLVYPEERLDGSHGSHESTSACQMTQYGHSANGRPGCLQ
jgi:hypothetical protein